MIDLPSDQFLAFYLALILAAVVAAALVRLAMTTVGAEAHRATAHAYEAAYLAGGTRRVIEAALASLMRQDVIRADSVAREVQITRSTQARHWVEKVIAAALRRGPVSPNRLLATCDQDLLAVERPLCKRGLCPEGLQRLMIRTVPGLIAASPVIAGLLRMAHRLPQHRPVGLLVLLCMVPICIGLAFASLRPIRNGTAMKLLARLREEQKRFSVVSWSKARSLDAADVALAVALFGPNALRDGPYYRLADTLSPQTTGGSGDGLDFGGGCDGGGGDCGGAFGDAF